MQNKAASRGLDFAIIAVLGLLTIFMLLPFMWLFAMSFRSVADACKMPPSVLPPSLNFENDRAVLKTNVPFLQIYINSVEIAVLVTLGQLVTCTRPPSPSPG